MADYSFPEALSRPNTKAEPFEQNIVLEGGGMGDVLCWMSAVYYMAKTHPHITGHVFVQANPMIPLIENILEPFKNWSVYSRDNLTDQERQQKLTRSTAAGNINATGFNLVDLGYCLLMNMDKCPDPEFDFYPRLNLENVKNPIGDKKYVVITIGSTYENRALGVNAFNAIKKEVLNQGLIPVFLGKKQMTENRVITFKDTFDLSDGINLIDRTTLMAAAKVLSGARAVIGLDNGLLHLAACSSDSVPIVFGYNITTVAHRRPRRRGLNPTFDVFIEPKELGCIGCQSRMRLILKPSYDKCFYGDNKCIELLDQGDRWVPKLKEALSQSIDT